MQVLRRWRTITVGFVLVGAHKLCRFVKRNIIEDVRLGGSESKVYILGGQGRMIDPVLRFLAHVD